MDPRPIAYGIRYKGHWCAGVRVGFARKPILIRAKKGQPRFEEPIPDEAVVIKRWLRVGLKASPATVKAQCDKVARVACARAIKRTNEAVRRVSGSNHLLRGVPSVERLLALTSTEMRNRRGKVWKICPIYYESRTNPPAVPPSEPRHDQEELVDRDFYEGRAPEQTVGVEPDPAAERRSEQAPADVRGLPSRDA